jgi:hypothetical protein
VCTGVLPGEGRGCDCKIKGNVKGAQLKLAATRSKTKSKTPA